MPRIQCQAIIETIKDTLVDRKPMKGIPPEFTNMAELVHLEHNSQI